MVDGTRFNFAFQKAEVAIGEGAAGRSILLTGASGSSLFDVQITVALALENALLQVNQARMDCCYIGKLDSSNRVASGDLGVYFGRAV